MSNTHTTRLADWRTDRGGEGIPTVYTVCIQQCTCCYRNFLYECVDDVTDHSAHRKVRVRSNVGAVHHRTALSAGAAAVDFKEVKLSPQQSERRIRVGLGQHAQEPGLPAVRKRTLNTHT